MSNTIMRRLPLSSSRAPPSPLGLASPLPVPAIDSTQRVAVTALKSIMDIARTL